MENELKTPDIEKEVKPKKEQKEVKSNKYSRKTSKETPLKVKRRRCIKRIHEIIDEYGPWSINVSDLAEEYSVEWNTAKSWFNGVLKSLDVETIDNMSRKGELMIERHLKRLEEIAEESEDKNRVAAMRTSFKGLDTLGSWLERFGRKQKIAEKLEVSGKLVNRMEVEIIEIQKHEDEEDDEESDDS